MMTRLQASIVIPAYNSAGRVHIPLGALSLQGAEDGSFEVVVVDNCSTDGTAEAVMSHPAVAALKTRGIDCRIVREGRKGLTFARICGVLEARSDLICFLDDDTAPEPTYVAAGIRAFDDVAVGLVVSRVYPDFETKPPFSVERRQHLFAVNKDLGEAVIELTDGASFAPTLGAGMWLRREVFLTAVPWQEPGRLLSDRSGRHLSSGGDIEIGHLIGRTGFKRIYDPELRLSHSIPRARLKTRYVCRLITGIVRSTCTLEARYGGRRHNAAARLNALSQVVLAGMAAPLVVSRRDGLREVLFILVSRWARLRGPYKRT
jgi:glycosyltransferase involved in cell wall biosynthesis